MTSATCSDGSPLGNISLSPGEVVTCTFNNTKRSNLVVKKVTDPTGSPQSFAFTATGPSTIAGFGLTDGQSHTSTDVLPGSYTITEADLAKWNLEGVTCDKGSPVADVANQKVTVDVAPGATVTCTFTNTQDAVLIVEKQTLPNGATKQFEFEGDSVFGAGNSALLSDGQQSSVGLPPGSYDVSELATAGWQLTDLVCSDEGDEVGASTTSLGDATASYDLQAGEVVTCVFTNTKEGSIEVRKVTDPADSPETFTFSSDVDGLFSQGSDELGNGDSRKQGGLLPGTYTVNEVTELGWDLTDLTCTGGSFQAATDGGALTGKVDIDLQPGEDIVCTYTNTERGAIVVKKNAIGADEGDSGETFSYTGDAAGSISIPIASDEEIRVDNLVPGTYTSTEGFTTGWSLDSITCDDGESDTPSTTSAATSTASFKVDPGETVVCTFTNVKLELDKTSNPSTTNADPTIVPRASTITYTVTVTNPGTAPVPSSALVDYLPANVSDPFDVTAVQGTWDSYAYDPTGNGTITWMVSLGAHETKIFTYKVTVDDSAPGGGELLNRVTWQDLEDSTLHIVGVPVPTLDKFANPVTTDAAPTLVQPGTRIDYSINVGNTGNFPITDAPVVDTLPNNVTAIASTISDGGVLSGDGKTITWTVTLAPGASKTFTYAVTVNQAAPQGSVLVNTARFQNLTDTTTHVVPTGAMTIVKGVTPVAGNGVVVNFGDTLTYTLTASATGTLDQPNVVVTDYLPGFDPARPTSGKTTYVAGSAKCIGAGTCTVTGPDANHLLTWSLGSMAAGTSRQVTFQVTINDVTGAAGETVAVDILNAGAVKSDRTPLTPSNQVRTPVSKVLPVKVHKPPVVVLPHTGATLPVGPTVGGAIAMLGLGLLLMVAAGRRRTSWLPRR
jgi:uncharacterized repeat protein (TIGR01451 family)